MLTYLLPTRNRPERLAVTLAALGCLDGSHHESAGGAEVIVVDDVSDIPVVAPPRLANGFEVNVVSLDASAGAAARNAGAEAARGTWLVMLDDDSAPLDAGAARVVADAPDDVAAIGGEITVPGASGRASGDARRRREDGGLPEVFVGCGAVVRRDAFLDVGGYDPSFHYYAEEYDLCARLLLAGWRVTHDRRFRVHHEKVGTGRDMNAIVRRLVRNNGWVVQRYAPAARRRAAIVEVVRRCRTIADREDARFGFEQGLDELMTSVDAQPAREMDLALWERFIGLDAARRGLRDDADLAARTAVRVVDEGKHASVVRDALAERGCEVVEDDDDAIAVIGTLSPGPMLDAWERRRRRGERAVMPWTPMGTLSASARL